MRRRFIRNREAVDEYFTIESLEDECVISLTDRTGLEGVGLYVWYSINNSHWTAANLSENPITLKKGYKVRFKYNSVMGTFVITKKCKILGSIMSLCFMDDFKNKTSLESHEFPWLFEGCSTIVSIDKGFLPATTLSERCYQGMFYGCTSLVNAPALPATTLASYCYNNMFRGCTSLVNAPELPAKTLADRCYYYMFYGCTSLVNAPELPATTLIARCYYGMFYGCTSLVNAPALPAKTLVTYCYQYMFRDCSKLSYIKAMFTTTPSADYTKGWVDGVASGGTFVKNSAATWNVTGVDGVPDGWTVETASS